MCNRLHDSAPIEIDEFLSGLVSSDDPASRAFEFLRGYGLERVSGNVDDPDFGACVYVFPKGGPFCVELWWSKATGLLTDHNVRETKQTKGGWEWNRRLG